MKRSKTSKAWMREHVTDPYVRRARREGLRSRAAYKLQQIVARDNLLRPGMLVVDLGAAPGGWSQFAARAVAPGGQVIALDVNDMLQIPGVLFVRGDVHDAATVSELQDLLAGRGVDLVLSDMAPNISGIGSVDQARALALAGLALEFALNHLKPHGNFLVKTFQGEGFDAFLKTLRGHFRQVVVRKPEASRSRSSEVYLLGRDLRGRSRAA
ncbi:MAG: RlmE family RNA methyltransferase [Betaproteobacteria bacterium]|nr:RlmE family RNA methyltransferase [Betaproteobacteria bacterium]